jgi:hypothetical protein
MRVRWLVIAPLAVALGLAASIAAQHRIDALHNHCIDDELLYLPNEKLLNHFTAGMGSVTADFLWLKCISYTHKHFVGDHKFVWLEHMYNMITSLDPLYGDVYRYGGIFLAALNADDDASIALLKRGFLSNPDRWDLPYETAMVYLLNRRDESNSAEMAVRYLMLALSTEKAPDTVLDIVEGLQRKHNLTDIERAMWEEMLQSDDAIKKELARSKLLELDLRETAERLTEAAATYEKRFGRRPHDVDELRASGLAAIPEDPAGGAFLIDSKGRVWSTTILDRAVEHRANRLRALVGRFREEQGRWPASLEELRSVSGRPIPVHPYEGRAWQYDPQTGEVEG